MTTGACDTGKLFLFLWLMCTSESNILSNTFDCSVAVAVNSASVLGSAAVKQDEEGKGERCGVERRGEEVGSAGRGRSEVGKKMDRKGEEESGELSSVKPLLFPSYISLSISLRFLHFTPAIPPAILHPCFLPGCLAGSTINKSS